MPRRTFNLLDAMVLIAATAAGFAVMRNCSPEEFTSQYTPIPPPTWLNWSSVVASNCALYLSPIPAAWTVATLLLRFRSPRPPLRRLMRQPGAVAACAAAPGIAIGAAHYLLELHDAYSVHSAPFRDTTYALGWAVGASWIVLALSGRWRPERSWLDRLGLALGVYWVGMIALMLYSTIGLGR